MVPFEQDKHFLTLVESLNPLDKELLAFENGQILTFWIVTVGSREESIGIF